MVFGSGQISLSGGATGAATGFFQGAGRLSTTEFSEWNYARSVKIE